MLLVGFSGVVIQLSQSTTVDAEDSISEAQPKLNFSDKVVTKQNVIKRSWFSGSKFTIHPFKSLHAKHLLPLSPTDYMARFGLEMVILGIAGFAIISNFSITAHANMLENSDESVIFSFLKSNPDLNNPLLATSGTTTILARADQWVSSAEANFSSSVVQAATTTGMTTIQENVIMKTNPADTQNFMRHGTTEYTVSSGDSIISIASSFGVSPQTIMMENKLNDTSTLRPGQKLTILPTTGITHTVGATETIESIASKYKVSEDDILDLNDIELAEDVSSGATLVIPLAKVEMPTRTTTIVKNNTNQISLKEAPAPANFIGGSDFVWPTPVRSITQGFHRLHSGLDISNSRKEAIYASADGFVELSGWRTGYGNTVIINHGNGFKTLYGHSSEIFVKAGEQVTKGQVIAKQGNTGRVRGATGIHLHFEIIKNGVKVNPLSYVRP